MGYTPRSPMDVVLYQMVQGMGRSGDLAGLRRVWGAIVPEFRELFPAVPPSSVAQFRASPGDQVFELGWRVYEALQTKHSCKTGRKVLDPVYRSGFATTYRKIAERETDNAPTHAAFLRILARLDADAELDD